MKEYLEFSTSQKRGIILLMALIAAMIMLNLFLPHLVSFPRVDHSAVMAAIEQHRDSVRIARSGIDSQPRKKRDQGTGKKTLQDHKPLIININDCDTIELMKLPGIGPVFASRIIKYRNLLGGYHLASQLLEVYGMDSARYEGIREMIGINKDLLSRINLNKAGFSELLRHPYLEYEDVKMIFRMRDIKGVIRSTEGFDTLFPSGSETWQKAAPYLYCGEP